MRILGTHTSSSMRCKRFAEIATDADGIERGRGATPRRLTHPSRRLASQARRRIITRTDTMKLIAIEALPPAAITPELVAAIDAASRAAFSLDLGDAVATLVLAAVRRPSGAGDPPVLPPGLPGPLTASAAAITELIPVRPARLRLRRRPPARLRRKTTRRRHAKIQSALSFTAIPRGLHCKLKATAFDLQKTPNTGPSCRHAILLSEHREPEMSGG